MKTLDMGLWNGGKYTSNLWKIQRWTLLLLMLAGFWTSTTQANVSITSITQDPANNVSVDVLITYRVTVSYPGGVDSGDSIVINIYDNDNNVTSSFSPENTSSCFVEGSIWCDSSYPDSNSDTFIITWTPSTPRTYNFYVSVNCVNTLECSGDSQSITTIVGNTDLPPQPPTANAGSDQNILDTDNNGLESVTLDGSGSTDLDNDITNYEWYDNFETLIATGVTPTVEFGPGYHDLTLIVTDSMQNTSSDTVYISIRSPDLAADAGPDQNVTDSDNDGIETVTLDASGSTIPYGADVSYRWTEGEQIIATVENPTVDLGVGTHLITLRIYQGEVISDSNVNISVQEAVTAIVGAADAGPDQTVTDTNNDGIERVTLDGSGSSVDGYQIESYEWFENGEPLGTGVELSVNLAVGSPHSIRLRVLYAGGEGELTDDVTITVQKPASSNNEATIETVSGDNQRLPEGDTSDPLSIRVLGPDGQPLEGVTITWIVIPADAATLSSDTTTTDSNGGSNNTVSLTAERTASPFQVTASILEGASARFQINPIAGISGLTQAQRSIAQALDNACPALQSLSRNLTTEEQSLVSTCDYLSTVSDQEIISALQQFLPDEIAAQGRNSISLARTRNKNILLRLNDLRRGANGLSLENISVSIQGEKLPSILISELTKSQRGGGASADSTELASRFGVFANGNISIGDTETTENAAGFDFETKGLTLGIDYRFSDQFVLGGAFNYISTNSDYINKSSTLDIDGYSLSLYGSYYLSEQIFADSILSIGLNNYDSQREFTTGGINHHFNGDTDGTEYALSLGGGYEFNYQNLTFVPQARINYLRVKADSYDETSSGSGLNLNIGDQDIESLITSVSGNMSLAYSTQYGVFMPYLSIEWEHEFQNDSRAIIARFVNDPTKTNFSVLTDEPDQDYFYVGLGLTAALAKGRSAFLYYEKLLEHSDTSQYTITAGFRLEF